MVSNYSNNMIITYRKRKMPLESAELFWVPNSHGTVTVITQEPSSNSTDDPDIGPQNGQLAGQYCFGHWMPDS